MKNKHPLRYRLLLGLCSLLFPVSALALVPPSVTGVTAQAIGNQIQVSWTPVSANDIAYYRVYYSTESILKNDGLYDDFEQTTGPTPTFTMSRPNSSPALFFAIIAVNTAGEESEFFTQEASVQFGAGTTSSVRVQPTISSVPAYIPSSQPTLFSQGAVSSYSAPAASFTNTLQTDILELSSAEALSATGVLATFSTAVTVDPAAAPAALEIISSKGEKLTITRITITGNEMVIFTKPQVRGEVYRVNVSEPFTGLGGQQLDTVNRSALFTGHATGIDAVQTPVTPGVGVTREVNPYSPPDIANFTFTPAARADGYYSLVVEWELDNTPSDIAYYLVYQTRDRGQTFSGPSVLPVDIRGVQLDGVTPGEYGLVIQTLNVYGYVSTGVFQNVYLAPIGQYRNPYQGNLLQDTNETVTTDVTFDDTSSEFAQLVPSTRGEEGVQPSRGEGSTFDLGGIVKPQQRKESKIFLVISLLSAGALLVAGSAFSILRKRAA